ncbi:hypothetical protein SAMN05421827_101490 [Pedobacter terrae]|uniref:Uncharacterized protein n=1 Tax=Pedobacter terrae TaxID=405671 RepID=A0A1G7NT69_9SPHI|nr:hypothetical protein SAMN05421827_101490 [Pedobacter terrae]
MRESTEKDFSAALHSAQNDDLGRYLFIHLSVSVTPTETH